jgi:hypothetical protein
MATDVTGNVLRVAQEIYDQRPSWGVFFRKVLGVEGIVRDVYNTPESLDAFRGTDDYRAICGMLAKLRADPIDWTEREPDRVITVRLPKSLHESLRAEAHDLNTSMNQLCISKLLEPAPAIEAEAAEATEAA